MIKRIAAATLGIALLASPLIASADQISDLQAQIATLTQQLQKLIANKAAVPVLSTDTRSTGVSLARCPNLTLFLAIGSTDAKTGGQVSQLQSFLNDYLDITEDIITGYFGVKTVRYVKQFQAQQGIEQIGQVGKLTRAAVARVCAQASIVVPTPPSPTPTRMWTPTIVLSTPTPVPTIIPAVTVLPTLTVSSTATSIIPTPITTALSTGTIKPVLITAFGSIPQGLDLFQSQNFLTESGTNLFVYFQNWSTIETSAGQFKLKDTITNPLTMIVPTHPYKGVLLIIKMIDTNTRTMPADLQGKSFGDPEVQQRFLAMLHAIAQEPSSKAITYMLLGNEVDSYFNYHPNELNDFMTLLKASIDQIHREMPGVKVGTGTSFNRDIYVRYPQLLQTLTQYSDFVDYTYYPSSGPSKDNAWQMNAVSSVSADLNAMAKAAGTKPVAFTEIGYSASPLNGSSEDQQAAFVTTVFDTLDEYRKQNRIAFIAWANMADYPPSVCNEYAQSQGIGSSPEFCAFMGNLGLRTYTDNKARKAWNTFVARLVEWGR